jgi:hypothetical protein
MFKKNSGVIKSTCTCFLECRAHPRITEDVVEEKVVAVYRTLAEPKDSANKIFIRKS